MTHQMTQEYETILKRALQLPLSQRAAMIEALAASFQDAWSASADDEDDTPLTDAQIAELMYIEPLPPAEIAARGLTGTWANLGISDGAEWVNQRKLRRSEQRRWLSFHRRS